MTDHPETNLTGSYFAVVNIETGVCIYSGKSSTAMAVRLAPGTCWGRGYTTEKAVQ